MAVKQMTVVGTIVTSPQWLLDLAVSYSVARGPAFPRLIDFDAHRAEAGANLPAERWGILWTTDHSTSSGSWGLAVSDSLESGWADSGASIYAGSPQHEFPHPVWDATNNRWVVIFHPNTSSVTHGHQQAYYTTTTDFETFTTPAVLLTDGHHTGYPWIDQVNGTYRMLCGWTGAEGYLKSLWTATDPTAWSLARIMSSNESDVMGTGWLMGSPGAFVRMEGGNFFITARQQRPRLDNAPASIVAVPYDDDWSKPLGGYYVLHTPAGSGDETSLTNYVSAYNIDGTVYVLYNSLDTNGDNVIRMGKLTGADATYTLPQTHVKLRARGTLGGGGNVTQRVLWDAASNNLPSTFSVSVNAGTNESVWTSGTGYRLATSTNGNLGLRYGTAIDPRNHYRVDWRMRGITHKDNGASAGNLFPIQFGYRSGMFGNENGTILHFNGGFAGFPGRPFGSLQHFNGVTNNANEDAYVMALCTTQSPVNAMRFNRAHPHDLSLIVYDFGARMAVLIDDSVAYDTSLSGKVTWTGSEFPYLRVLSSASTSNHVDFTGVEVLAYSRPLTFPLTFPLTRSLTR